MENEYGGEIRVYKKVFDFIGKISMHKYASIDMEESGQTKIS